jgi:hypothetical protein
MASLGDTRAHLIQRITGVLADAGTDPSVAVTGDPRQIVAPCVFIDLIELTARQAMRSWNGTINVHVIAAPDPDQQAIDTLDTLTGVILSALTVEIESVSPAVFYVPGGTALPEYVLGVGTSVDY